LEFSTLLQALSLFMPDFQSPIAIPHIFSSKIFHKNQMLFLQIALKVLLLLFARSFKHHHEYFTLAYSAKQAASEYLKQHSLLTFATLEKSA